MSHAWRGERVAVTGATGFLGFHLVRQLRQHGAAVTAFVRAGSNTERIVALGASCVVAPLDDPAALAAACRGCGVLFHLAGAVDFAGDWTRFRQANVEGTGNVLAAARQAGVRRFVHTSSIVAVGADEEPRLQNEASAWMLGRLRVPYVTTKREAEQLALAGSARDFDVVVVNPASVIGPEDHGRSEFGTLCRRFWRGRIPFHFGGGNNFVDVRDVAAGMLAAAERGRPGERYILGGVNRTHTAFFADMARAAGRLIPRFRLPAAVASFIAWANERMKPASGKRAYLSPAQARLLSLYFFFDTSKARRELGYAPRPWPATLADTHGFWMRGQAA